MRVPGDHTPLSRGRWITHRVLLTVMHICAYAQCTKRYTRYMWASRMSRRNHLGMWRGYQWPQIPHLKRGRSFTVFPLPALPLFGSLQFTFLRDWVVFDYVLLQCIPYVMATVLENAELCDTVSQCANLRVYKVHEFVRPLYMFVSQLHIWASEYVEGRGAVLVAGSEVDRSGNGSVAASEKFL